MSNFVNSSVKLILVLLCVAGANAAPAAPTSPYANATGTVDGIGFSCTPQQISRLKREMATYLRELDIPAALVVRTEAGPGKLAYALSTPAADTDTLSLHQRRQYRLHDETLRLPGADGRPRVVRTVARKEILLALLQHGRLTRLHGSACTLAALREHVALRQNIVAWSHKLSWGWPDGDSAYWHSKVWDQGTPLASVRVDRALLDAFLHQDKYRIGCYTAAKLVYAHAVLDFYVRVRKDKAKAKLVRQRLLYDKEPLVGVEPAAMWDFETDFDPATRAIPGKILRLQSGIAAGNFVPGDWIYLRNTDPLTSQKIGYEGSNAVYLGRGKFSDYYNDHQHAYAYAEKVDEVYQWRHGVFSRSRDAAKVQALSADDIRCLSKPPAEQGLLLDLRVVPYWFGFEALPRLPSPSSTTSPT